MRFTYSSNLHLASRSTTWISKSLLDISPLVLKGNPPFLNEDTWGVVETSASFWMIEDGELHIQFQKAHKAEMWSAALKGHGQLDMFSEQEVNKKLMLERFQEEHPNFDFTSAQFSGMAPNARTFMGGVHADPRSVKGL